MKSHTNSILALALLLQSSMAFQTSSFVATRSVNNILSSVTCNRSSSNQFATNKKQQRQHKGALYLSSQGSIIQGRENLSTRQSPKLKRGSAIAAAAAAAFIATFGKASPTHAAAAVVMPVAGTEGGSIIPLIFSPPYPSFNFKNMLLPLKANSRRAIFAFVLVLFATAASTALLLSAGNGDVHVSHIPKLWVRRLSKETVGEESDLDLGLPKEVDWETYSLGAIDPLCEKKNYANHVG